MKHWIRRILGIKSAQQREIDRIMAQVDQYGYAIEPVPPGHPAWCAYVRRVGHPPGTIHNGMADASPESRVLFDQWQRELIEGQCGTIAMMSHAANT